MQPARASRPAVSRYSSARPTPPPRRTPAPAVDEPGTQPPADGPVDARRDLERAFAFLRPEERIALSLAYAQDLTHEEAAEAAGWPVGTLKSHLLRGKEKLRQRLVPQEGAA